MNEAKKQRLERNGWKVGSARELLGLSDAESEYIELKLLLSRDLRTRRAERGLTQMEFAKIIGSSQSRVAKMEAGDVSVSIDLLIHSLLALGVTRKEIGRMIAKSEKG